MGNSRFVDFDKFPKQGEWLHKAVKVTFHFAAKTIDGKIIRDDMDGDCLTIIQLDDGRVILGAECQYALKE